MELAMGQGLRYSSCKIIGLNTQVYNWTKLKEYEAMGPHLS